MKLTPTFISTKEVSFSIPYPEGPELHLDLEIPFGRATVRPGGEQLLTATARFDVKEFEPVWSVQGGRVSVGQEAVVVPAGATNEWEITLGGAKSFELTLSAGAGHFELDLGGLPLTGLKVEAGAADLRVTFGAPNPIPMAALKAATGAGRLALSGLLNANMAELKVGGGAGQVLLRFEGETLRRSAAAVIDTAVGDVSLVLDRTCPCRVSVQRAPARLTVASDLLERDGGYQTLDYAYAAAKLEVLVSTALARVTVETV